MPARAGKSTSHTHLSLAELEGALVPANLQQLGDPALIGCQASHLPHNVPHELDTLGRPLQWHRLSGVFEDQVKLPLTAKQRPRAGQCCARSCHRLINGSCCHSLLLTCGQQLTPFLRDGRSTFSRLVTA